MKIITRKEGKDKVHIIGDVRISCSGVGCLICEQQENDLNFLEWEQTIPFPIPSKGKKYKKKKIQKNRGKTIQEICYSCRKIPCYICSRTECSEWMKDRTRKGQEEGCVDWEEGRCSSFYCERGLIKTHWHTFKNRKKKR